MPFSEIHIAPDVKRVIESLRGDLKEKVKNAMRDISVREEVGTNVNLLHFETVLGSENFASAVRLYKAGRFRILFRRTNGTVWVDALTLDGAPNFSGSAKLGGAKS